jgi:hypothetical protein
MIVDDCPECESLRDQLSELFVENEELQAKLAAAEREVGAANIKIGLLECELGRAGWLP